MLATYAPAARTLIARSVSGATRASVQKQAIKAVKATWTVALASVVK